MIFRRSYKKIQIYLHWTKPKVFIFSSDC